MNMLGILCFLTLFLQVFYQEVHGDVYLHVPRGSNNRLNSAGANRKNAKRVFDSQVRQYMCIYKYKTLYLP